MAKADEKFVTKEDFNKKFEGLESAVGSLVDLLKEKNKPEALTNVSKAVEAKKEEDEAKAFQAPINPLWESKAREILGEKLDHCEVDYPKSGGLRFTLVIKKEFSNAPKDYLERYKADRRTKEVGQTGIDGVIRWCQLVKQNLDKK